MLAPPVCVGCGVEGYALCMLCQETEILPYGEKCWRCGRMTERAATCNSCSYLHSPRFIWISTDYAGAAKELVKIYKFGHLRTAAVPMAAIMKDTLLQYNTDEELNKKNYLIVPVPTATKRIRQRGFDHAVLLAKEISHLLKLNYGDYLARLGQNRQVGASKAQRAKQLERAFHIKNTALITGRNILLIDDVITTGATLTELAKTLRMAGAKSINALVFAK